MKNIINSIRYISISPNSLVLFRFESCKSKQKVDTMARKGEVDGTISDDELGCDGNRLYISYDGPGRSQCVFIQKAGLRACPSIIARLGSWDYDRRIGLEFVDSGDGGCRGRRNSFVATCCGRFSFWG